MPTLLLVRHGRTTANAAGVLAGRSPGVELDEKGRDQATQAGRRISAVPLAAVVSSPMERCRQTAELLSAEHDGATPAVEVDPGLSECDYGQWQGRPLAELAKEELWAVVQNQPSAAVFPGGESLRAMQARVVAAVRERDAAVAARDGAGAVWLAVSHGDLIKAVLADALGMHLDLFQRLDVHPGSVSVVRYGAARPAVLAVNTAAGNLGWVGGDPPKEATVGGGRGPSMG